MSYCSLYALDVYQSLMYLEEVTKKSETSDVHVAKCADFPRRYLAQNSGEDFTVGVIKARLYCFLRMHAYVEELLYLFLPFLYLYFLGPKFT